MKIGYNVTIDDVVAFNMHHFKNSPAMRKQVRFGVIFTCGLILICFSLIAMSNKSYGDLIIGIITASVFACVYPGIYRWSAKRNVLKLYGEGKNVGVLGEHILEVTNTEIIDKADSAESKSKISRMERIESTPDYVFIYMGAVIAHIIPRNSILEGDVDAFLEEVKKRFEQSQ